MIIDSNLISPWAQLSSLIVQIIIIFFMNYRKNPVNHITGWLIGISSFILALTFLFQNNIFIILSVILNWIGIFFEAHIRKNANKINQPNNVEHTFSIKYVIISIILITIFGIAMGFISKMNG